MEIYPWASGPRPVGISQMLYVSTSDEFNEVYMLVVSIAT